MRSILFVLAMLTLLPQPASAQSCTADAETLCFEEGRFSMRLGWRDSDSNLLSASRIDSSGQAAAIPAAEGGGFFGLDSEDRIDAVVKLLDGTAINDSFWVFAAVLSAREFTLTVTDTMSGAIVEYSNPLGELPDSIFDLQAFPQPAQAKRQPAAETASVPPAPREDLRIERKGTGCNTDQGQACLLDDRFEVSVTWRDVADNTGNGMGQALRPGTGAFWFFSPDNIELIVKVTDARSINDNFWYGFAALTNLEFTIRVLDLETGLERSYLNPLGNEPKSVIDPGTLGRRINRGHSGFWFNPETPGQGIALELHRGLGRLGFLAFFGFEPNPGTKLGAGDQRWLTGQGNYAGDTLDLELFSTSGGAFDDPQPVMTDPVGSARFVVEDCRTATLAVDLPAEAVSTSIPLERLLPQPGGLRDACAALALGAEIRSLEP